MFTTKPLPYDYDALEPIIDEATMRVHHDKHYQTYCDKLNLVLEKYPEGQGQSIEELLAGIDNLPDEIRLGVRNMGGGYLNHTDFFDLLAPASEGGKPSSALLEAIKQKFGDQDTFQKEFNSLALNLFGSGWTFLTQAPSGQLEIVNLSNQDSPILTGHRTLIGLDLWEHAYYLKYQNRRAEYLAAWWGIINWTEVNRRFEQ